MKRYIQPILDIDLFDEDVIVCSDGEVGGDDGIIINWYRPEFEDE